MDLHKIISSLHAKETQKSNLNSDMKKSYTPYTTKLVIIWKKNGESNSLNVVFHNWKLEHNVNNMETVANDK